MLGAVLDRYRRWFEHVEAIHHTVRHVMVENPLALGSSYRFAVIWAADERTRSGETAHLQGVTVMDVRRGKVSAIRQYLFDLGPQEALWRSGAAVPPRPAEADFTGLEGGVTQGGPAAPAAAGAAGGETGLEHGLATPGAPATRA